MDTSKVIRTTMHSRDKITIVMLDNGNIYHVSLLDGLAFPEGSVVYEHPNGSHICRVLHGKITATFPIKDKKTVFAPHSRRLKREFNIKQVERDDTEINRRLAAHRYYTAPRQPYETYNDFISRVVEGNMVLHEDGTRFSDVGYPGFYPEYDAGYCKMMGLPVKKDRRTVKRKVTKRKVK
jgi:hypothetical protein